MGKASRVAMATTLSQKPLPVVSPPRDPRPASRPRACSPFTIIASVEASHGHGKASPHPLSFAYALK